MPTFQVNQSYDDGYEAVSGGSVNLSSTSIVIGGANRVGFRIRSTGINRKTGIAKALLKFPTVTSATGSGVLSNVTLRGGADVWGSSSAYNDGGSGFTGFQYMPKTYAAVDGTKINATSAQFTTGIDVTEIVQEILDNVQNPAGSTYNPSSTNFIFVFEGTGTTTNSVTVGTYDGAIGSGAVLDITYTNNSAQTPTTGAQVADGDSTWTINTSPYSLVSPGAGTGGWKSNRAKVQGLGFNIPANAYINGIDVKFDAVGSLTRISSVRLLDSSGNPAGYDHKYQPNSTTIPGSATAFYYGGTTDTWGKQWTPADINSSNFGIALRIRNTSGGGGSATLNNFTVTVHYTNENLKNYSVAQTYLGVEDDYGYYMTTGNQAYGEPQGLIRITNTTGRELKLTRLTLNMAAVYSVVTTGGGKDGPGETYTYDRSANPLILRLFPTADLPLSDANAVQIWNRKLKGPNAQEYNMVLDSPYTLAVGGSFAISVNATGISGASEPGFVRYLGAESSHTSSDSSQINYKVGPDGATPAEVTYNPGGVLYELYETVPPGGAVIEGGSSMSVAGYAVSNGSSTMSGNSDITASGFMMGQGSASIVGDSKMYADRVNMVGGSVMLVDGVINPLAITKTYQYKIYDENWNYLGVWDDVVSEFGYSQEINSGGSAISVTLARNSDSGTANYDVIADDNNTPIVTDDDNEIAAEIETLNTIGPGTTVDLNLNVKIYEFSSNTTDIAGDLVFTGYISMYTSQYGTTENTVVSIFSYGADLDNYVLTDGNNTRVPYLSMDPSQILRGTLDKFNTDGGIVSYFHNDTSIEFSGTGSQHAVSNADFNLGLTNANIFTFATWVYSDTYAGNPTLWSGNNATGVFQFDLHSGSAGNGSIRAFVNGIVVADTTTGPITINNWHHIVYVKNGTGAGASTMYVNGAAVSLSTNAAYTFLDTATRHYIAGRNDTQNKFNGKLDETMIFDQALNSTQVTALYTNATRPATPKVWYKYDENNGYSIANSGSKTGADMFLAGGNFVDDVPPSLLATQTTPNTVENTDTVVTYTFNANTMLEVIKKCLELAPTDWFFYPDLATNLLYFKPRPTVPDHYFYLGKHILNLSLEKTMEGIVNDVIFTGGTPTYAVLDRFFGATGTDLLGHTGETGASWTKHPASVAGIGFVLTNGNRLRANQTGENIYLASGQASTPNYIITTDYYMASTTGADFGVVGRVDPSAQTYYLARIHPSGSTIVELYKCISGTYTLLQSTNISLTAGQTYKFEFKMDGRQMTINVNGRTYIDLEDGSIQTGTLSGVRAAAASSDVAGYHMDNFSVKNLENANVPVLYRRYTDPTSIANYRRGVQRVTDNRVSVPASADTIVASLINRSKDPRYRSTITISASTYNIRSIKLGHLIGFKNFGNYIDDTSNPIYMQVVRIDYKPDSVTLQLDTLLPSVPKRLEDINRNLNQEQVADNPDAPS